ncbi:MAG: hydantoinase/oxoprolinase family protein [Hyphomicrobiaceae bacterium]
MTRETRPVRIGVDIGGTFTDLEIYDARTGLVRAFKLPTTPEDPSIGLIEGIKGAGQRYGFALADVGYVLHGTTIATNAVLERKFPPGALVTTAGFEDVLEIGRHNRRDVYSVWPRPVPVLIPRDRRLGIRERLTAQGWIETPLTEAALADLVQRLAALDVKTVAVSLLNAYVDGRHEAEIGARLARDLGHLTVSLSSAVSPEVREYERTSTTVLNALLMPVVRGYLDRLQRRMEAEGFAPRLLIVQSNGGVSTPETAAAEPVRLLLSGPSGGALASLRLSRTLGEPALVGVDMGGTSFDVSVVRDDRIEIVTQGEIDRLPVRVPMIEIRTIGAGGGSLARVQPGGRLTVGPESAGARPGPVCYGRGGTEPAVTDANVILGRLDPEFFLGGTMALDLDGARRAMVERIGRPLGLGLEAAASGVLSITNASLAAAIRLSLFEKGLDPRDFAILSFGGAGSIHACAVAEELGIRRVIFPVGASTFSAFGILHSDIRHGFARSRVMAFDEAAVPPLVAMAEALSGQADSRLTADGIAAADRELIFSADLRYKGQAFELTVPWQGATFDAGAVAAVAAAFHRLHEQRFSYCNPHDRVEIVTLRLDAVGRLPAFETRDAGGGESRDSDRRRAVFVDGGWQSTAVWRRGELVAGVSIAGPAIVEEDYTTVLIAPGWVAQLGAGGHIVATREG